jgi:hypothetical protein
MFLGYAIGRGNYKVQDISSRCVFVSCDVIFEEGQPHCTSPSVRENLPLFDTSTSSNPLDDNVGRDNKHPNTSEHLNNPDHHVQVDNPAEPIIPMEPIQQTP